MNQRNFLRALVASAVFAMLSGCATAPASPSAAATEKQDGAPAVAEALKVAEDPKAPIERRVTDRWKLLVAGDAVRAYTYLTPGIRSAQTVEQYGEWLKSRQIKWKVGKYMDRQCEDSSTCTVSVLVVAETKMPGIPGVQEASSVIEEKWLQFDGVWYHLPKNAR